MDARTQARIQNRKQQKLRERQLLVYGAAGLLILLSLLFLFPRKKVVNAAQLDQPTAQEMSRAPKPMTPQETASSQVAATTPMNILPLSEITPDMVTGINGGATPTLEFRDGSRRLISSSEVQQLPGEIRIRLEYSRDRR